jgi:prepilin-type N-terminal cleavage/methylation domain-containing protein
MMRADSQNAGFTLAELMIVVVLVGILSGIAVVTLSQRWSQERLLAAARETHSWLDAQRRLAMKEGQACEITINTSNASLDPTGNTISLSDGSSLSNSCSSQVPLSIRDTVQNGSGITLTTSPNDANAIRFSFRGLSEVTTNTGTTNELVLKLNQPGSNKQRCIKVLSPLGLIRNGWATANSETCMYSNSF